VSDRDQQRKGACLPVPGCRCRCCAGAELTDATEAVALAADECTIAAGCIGDLLAAQVPCPQKLFI
jgi:hypothetical protein